ncbi:MAG: hypothetical protein R3Y54_12300, partial [Eubacteriales bacterium]
YALGGIQFNAPNINFKSPLGEILALKMNTTMEVTESSISTCNQFDIKGKNGTILKGTVFVYYEPFDDAPMEKGVDVWGLVGNVLAGIVAVVVVATIVATVAGAVVLTGGASLAVAAVSIGKGALIGGVIAVGVTAGMDVWNKEVSSTAEYVFVGAMGAITGAIGTGLSTLKFAKLAKFSKSFKFFNTTLKIGGDDFAIAVLQVGEGAITGAGESIVSQLILEGKTWKELNWYDVGFNSLINGGIGFLAPNIVSGTKTIGGATGEINGKNITLESISGGTKRGNFVVTENNYYTGGPWPDNVHHTEQNMIEFLRNEYADTVQDGTSAIVGKIKIVSDFEICDNCNWIIDSFQNEFPNIDIIRVQVRSVP